MQISFRFFTHSLIAAWAVPFPPPIFISPESGGRSGAGVYVSGNHSKKFAVQLVYSSRVSIVCKLIGPHLRFVFTWKCTWSWLIRSGASLSLLNFSGFIAVVYFHSERREFLAKWKGLRWHAKIQM